MTPPASAGALRLAHRGDWRRAPENSLAAMRAALAVPACGGLEFDVRFSSDSVPILLHDATLERVQHVGRRAADLTAAQLAALGIPALREVLPLASRPGASGTVPFLDIELKEAPNEAFFEAVDAARGHADGGLDRAVVSSFHPEMLAAVRERRPGWPVWGNARDLDPSTVAVATGLGCRGLSVTWRRIDARSAQRALDAGLELAAWTVRRRATFDRLERLGLVAICVEAAALDG